MNENMMISGADFPGAENREAVRVAKKISARIKDNLCTVLNISKKGVLLETSMPLYWFPISEVILFELEIEGEWMSVNGIVKWVSTDQEHSRVGVFIKHAPEAYVEYLRQLYS
jgi:hypothetical protein